MPWGKSVLDNFERVRAISPYYPVLYKYEVHLDVKASLDLFIFVCAVCAVRA